MVPFFNFTPYIIKCSEKFLEAAVQTLVKSKISFRIKSDFLQKSQKRPRMLH